MLNRRTLLASLAAAIGFGSKARAQVTECGLTRADAKGPFFVSDTPIVDNLNRWGKSGEPMVIVGRVLDGTDPSRPVANARIELWQTDGKGLYYPQNNGRASDYGGKDIDMRGTVIAGEDGQYSVASLVPGRYEPRPRHIHFQLSAPGFKTLVTQIYVSDGEDVPGGPCRSSVVDRSQGQARFKVPDILLERL